jgi:hypothetical protein
LPASVPISLCSGEENKSWKEEEKQR